MKKRKKASKFQNFAHDIPKPRKNLKLNSSRTDKKLKEKIRKFWDDLIHE